MNEILNITNSKEIKKPLFMFENGIFFVKEQIIKWLNQVSQQNKNLNRLYVIFEKMFCLFMITAFEKLFKD